MAGYEDYVETVVDCLRGILPPEGLTKVTIALTQAQNSTEANAVTQAGVLSALVYMKRSIEQLEKKIEEYKAGADDNG